MNLITAFLSLFMVTKSTNSISLNCQFIDLNACPACVYQCKAVNVIITKENQTVTKLFTNNPESDKITALKIHDQVVHHMPAGLENFFPVLAVLQVWSCGLRSLTQNDIKAHENLKELSLSGNDIEVLDSNLFKKNTKITRIDFSRNRLKHVGHNLLLPLEALIFADFYHNDCISDGSRSLTAMLIASLRKLCKPTSEMLTADITALNEKVNSLTTELKTCEKIHKNRRCGDDNSGEHIVGLDSLFPFYFINEENRIE